MDYLFTGCENLASINLKNSAPYKLNIATWLFQDCISLTSAELSSFKEN